MATSTKTKKAVAKKAAPPAAKTTATKKAAKPAPKPTAKSATKPTAKPTAKPAAKAAAKPAVTKAASTKPVEKTATKPAAKPAEKIQAAKTPIKTEAKPTAKPVAAVSAPAPAAKPAAPTNSSKSAAIKLASSVNSSFVPVAKTNTVPKPAIVAPTPAKPILVAFDSVKKFAGFTEAEIVKQPESDYMNKAQLAFFKEKLTELRGTIIHNATDTGEHLRDVEVATDPSDRATQEEEYTLELRTRDRERKLLKKVDKCLRMIDDGSFGWCEETGEPIGLARLIARPTATLSIEAQERRERMQKLYGD